LKRLRVIQLGKKILFYRTRNFINIFGRTFEENNVALIWQVPTTLALQFDCHPSTD